MEKFGVEALHVMPLSCRKFHEIRRDGSRFVLRGLHEIFLVFCTFSSHFDKIRYGRCSQNLNCHEFGASAQIAALLRLAINHFLADFYIYCPIF